MLDSDHLQRERECVPPTIVDFLVERLKDELAHKTLRNQALTAWQQVTTV